MRLVIDTEIKRILEKAEKISELLPRDSCKSYIDERTRSPFLLKKEEFDELTRKKQFKDGPYKEGFGDGYGEPYNPHRQLFGTLISGEIVYCEYHSDMDKKVNSLLELMASEPGL